MMKKRIGIILALVFLLSLTAAVIPTSAATEQQWATVVQLYNSVGAAVDASSTTRTATFLDPSFPRDAFITDVDITIVFEKIDDGPIDPPTAACPSIGGAGHQGGGAFNNEIYFTLTSPNGTAVPLVTTSTYSGGTYGGVVTVTFNDGAGAPPSGTPTSGIFQPVSPLSAFDGEEPFGNWNLTIGDSVGLDPLCYYSMVISITLDVPQFLIQRTGSCVLEGIDNPIGYGLDNPFTASGRGYLSALRFDYIGGGVAGWLYPSEVTKSGQDWTATFVNANSDGTIAIEPGTYRVYCFGFRGTAGNGLKTTVTK